ncbi:MAG TPA: DUF692 domain-containing protein [Tepidisphaeraceae bacterium]|jgi:hypothetical protein
MIIPPIGLGIGWRPPLALDIDRRADLGFVEIVAENIDPANIPTPLRHLRARGVAVIPHGVSLSLGGAEPIDKARVRRLAELAREFDAPLASEHIAFVRAGGQEAGHLLPLPRTRAALDALIDNVRTAQDLLPVPLALENIAALFEWPDREMDETEFLGTLLDRTGAMLLLDLANVWANARNLGGDPVAMLTQMPLDRLAYVHVAGGEERDGTYHDTHAAAVPPGVLELLSDLCRLADPPGVMLERDDHFPPGPQLNLELDAIAAAVARGRDQRNVQRQPA